MVDGYPGTLANPVQVPAVTWPVYRKEEVFKKWHRQCSNQNIVNACNPGMIRICYSILMFLSGGRVGKAKCRAGFNAA